MADNVAITAGAGTIIGAEDQNGVEYQRIIAWTSLTSPYAEAAINVAGSGDNQIIAAVSAKQIIVFGFFLVAAGAVSIKWRDGTSDFHPALPLIGQGASWFLPRDGIRWFVCSTNVALNLNLSAAVQVSGRIYYRLGG